MGNPAEGSGGSPIDATRNDNRRNTDVRSSKESANAKASGGSTPATEGGKYSTGHKRIEAAKPAGGGDEKSVTDPAGPEGRGGYNRTDSVNFIREGAPMSSTDDIGEVEQ